MGKLTPDVFNESCCDGGECSTEMSAQSCGCDKGANWTCQRHTLEKELSEKYEQAKKDGSVSSR